MAWIVLSTRDGEQNVEFATSFFGALRNWLRLHFREDTVVRRIQPAERDGSLGEEFEANEDYDGGVVIGMAEDNLDSASSSTCGLPT